MKNYTISSAKFRSLGTTEQGFQIEVTEVKSFRNQVFDFKLTNHAIERVRRRNISPELLALVLSFGTVSQKQGFEYYVLGKKEIIANELDIRLYDSVVVVLKNDVVITSYYSDGGKKHIRKKCKMYKRGVV